MTPTAAPVIDRPVTTAGLTKPVLDPTLLGPALTLGDALPIGQYRVDLRTGRWWWSDEVYVVHGLEPGSVEPSADLMTARKHPDDRARVLREMRRTLRTGRPFSCMHRIVDSRGRTRTVVLTGQGRRDGARGELLEIAGYLVDLTAVHRTHVERDTARSLDTALEGRAHIDQARGVLRALLALDEDAASDRLVGFASRAEVTVRDVAEKLLGWVADGDTLDDDGLERFLETLRDAPDQRQHAALLVRRGRR